jgi:hypothetical protein
MAFKLPPTTTLPGGRKVRDYSALTVDALKAAVKDDPQAAEVALDQEEAKPKPRKGAIEALEKEAAKAEDESLG